MLWSIFLDPTKTDKNTSSFNKVNSDVSKSNSVTEESAHMQGSLSTRSRDTFMLCTINFSDNWPQKAIFARNKKFLSAHVLYE